MTITTIPSPTSHDGEILSLNDNNNIAFAQASSPPHHLAVMNNAVAITNHTLSMELLSSSDGRGDVVDCTFATSHEPFTPSIRNVALSQTYKEWNTCLSGFLESSSCTVDQLFADCDLSRGFQKDTKWMDNAEICYRVDLACDYYSLKMCRTREDGTEERLLVKRRGKDFYRLIFIQNDRVQAWYVLLCERKKHCHVRTMDHHKQCMHWAPHLYSFFLPHHHLSSNDHQNMSDSFSLLNGSSPRPCSPDQGTNQVIPYHSLPPYNNDSMICINDTWVLYRLDKYGVPRVEMMREGMGKCIFRLSNMHNDIFTLDEKRIVFHPLSLAPTEATTRSPHDFVETKNVSETHTTIKWRHAVVHGSLSLRPDVLTKLHAMLLCPKLASLKDACECETLATYECGELMTNPAKFMYDLFGVDAQDMERLFDVNIIFNHVLMMHGQDKSVHALRHELRRAQFADCDDNRLDRMMTCILLFKYLDSNAWKQRAHHLLQAFKDEHIILDHDSLLPSFSAATMTANITVMNNNTIPIQTCHTIMDDACTNSTATTTTENRNPYVRFFDALICALHRISVTRKYPSQMIDAPHPSLLLGRVPRWLVADIEDIVRLFPVEQDDELLMCSDVEQRDDVFHNNTTFSHPVNDNHHDDDICKHDSIVAQLHDHHHGGIASAEEKTNAVLQPVSADDPDSTIRIKMSDNIDSRWSLYSRCCYSAAVGRDANPKQEALLSDGHAEGIVSHQDQGSDSCVGSLPSTNIPTQQSSNGPQQHMSCCSSSLPIGQETPSLNSSPYCTSFAQTTTVPPTYKTEHDLTLVEKDASSSWQQQHMEQILHPSADKTVIRPLVQLFYDSKQHHDSYLQELINLVVQSRSFEPDEHTTVYSTEKMGKDHDDGRHDSFLHWIDKIDQYCGQHTSLCYHDAIYRDRPTMTAPTNENDSSLSLPCHPNISREDVERIKLATAVVPSFASTESVIAEPPTPAADRDATTFREDHQEQQDLLFGSNNASNVDEHLRNERIDELILQSLHINIQYLLLQCEETNSVLETTTLIFNIPLGHHDAPLNTVSDQVTVSKNRCTTADGHDQEKKNAIQKRIEIVTFGSATSVYTTTTDMRNGTTTSYSKEKVSLRDGYDYMRIGDHTQQGASKHRALATTEATRNKHVHGFDAYKAAITDTGKPCIVVLRIPGDALVACNKAMTKYRTNRCTVKDIIEVDVRVENHRHQYAYHVLTESSVALRDVGTEDGACPLCVTNKATQVARPCNHNLCLQCWMRLFQETPSKGGTRLKCPYCMQQVDKIEHMTDHEVQRAKKLVHHKTAYSIVSPKTIEYKVGSTIQVHDFDPHLDAVCTPGIHFHRELEEAYKWFEYMYVDVDAMSTSIDEKKTPSNHKHSFSSFHPVQYRHVRGNNMADADTTTTNHPGDNDHASDEPESTGLEGERSLRTVMPATFLPPHTLPHPVVDDASIMCSQDDENNTQSMIANMSISETTTRDEMTILSHWSPRPLDQIIADLDKEEELDDNRLEMESNDSSSSGEENDKDQDVHLARLAQQTPTFDLRHRRHAKQGPLYGDSLLDD